MRRPILFRFLPPRLKAMIFYRWYRVRWDKWAPLFEKASLDFAPGMAMHLLVPGDIISGSIAFTGHYELDLSRRMKRLANRGGVMVDIGANMGYFSLLWAGLNPLNRVVAFEAAPRNIELLRNNVLQNALSDRIMVVPKAAGMSNGTLAFDFGPPDQTGWGGAAEIGSSIAVDVPLVRLDAELVQMKIDVLKIDVEGADTWVLFGCEKLIRKQLIGTIFFEQNLPRMEKLGVSPGDAQEFLRAHGYTCVPLNDSETEWMAYPAAGTGNLQAG